MCYVKFLWLNTCGINLFRGRLDLFILFYFFKLPTDPSKVNTAAYFWAQQRYFCKGQDLRAHPFFRMNDETAMAGGKVSRSGGGNEPPLTDKRAELRQVAQPIMTSAQQFTLQNKSQTSVTSESKSV